MLISLINQYGTEKIREIRKNFKDQIINNCAADQSSLESIIHSKAVFTTDSKKRGFGLKVKLKNFENRRFFYPEPECLIKRKH